MDQGEIKQCTKVSTPALSPTNINGYITVAYDKRWYVGLVIDKDDANSSCTVSFMIPPGPSQTQSFRWPPRPDVLEVSFQDVLSKIDLSTSTGRTYQATEEAQNKATTALRKYSETH